MSRRLWSMSKKVTVYNTRRGVEQTFPSMAEAARTLDVDVSQVEKARKTGSWVFAKGLEVRVRS